LNKFILLSIILFFVSCGGGFNQDVKGPKVTLLYPNIGYVASDSVEVRYEVSDESQVFKMNLRLNGFEEFIMNTDLSSPNKFYYMLHVSEFESGSITIQGVGEDEFGNVGESVEVEIFIDNSLRFINIPSGIFTDSGNNETEILYDYQMMTYPVTVGQYLVFLNEAYTNGVITISGNKIKGNVSTITAINDFISFGDSSFVHHLGAIEMNNNKFRAMDSTYINHPITGVTWYGATAFAEYYKMRLPSVSEWEKVARGITGYAYPWGNENNSNRSNFDNSGDPWESGTTPVGYYNGINISTIDSKSPFGAYDMAGNVWEWTSEINSVNKYILKGGSYQNPAFNQTTIIEHTSYPADILSNFGFRCARDL